MDQLTEAEAASLALALVAVATASVDGGQDARDASDRCLVELVDGLCDVPLTERQADVIETIGTASAALTAGLGSAIATDRDCDVHVVLRLAARAVLDQTDGGGHRAV
ncbi:hypothetical protein AX769_05260 [Frondihabitans sp. PAMC 28766]|uniref:hypothetical protein n=1 Tax=Frondihabitans sp. PAMC 28766 TaxID=1795630 RepID=UPI00078D8667|nr:hypothetical protein [Frondihabitans sp. PAMC 28766]AMM19656.1 hypothetical protein AX769_05260 [Frondihabitans sp. PAMC 28766]